MTELEMLLRRYSEGDITPEELQQLDILTHKEEVWAGASARARVLRRQRVARMSVAASFLLVVAVGLFFAFRTGGPVSATDSMLVASVDPPQMPSVDETPAMVEESPVLSRRQTAPSVRRVEVAEARPVVPEEVSVPEVLQEDVQPAVRQEVSAEGSPSTAAGPVVACNSECSPDSVINDIWRFLRV